MVCNDVKYCLEKDADSYYGRAGAEPFNLKPPGPGACKKMLTRQFHCQSVTVAREYFHVRPFFFFCLASFAFSLASAAQHHHFLARIFTRDFSSIFKNAKRGSLTSRKAVDDFRKIRERNAIESLIILRRITPTLCARDFLLVSFTFYLINVCQL